MSKHTKKWKYIVKMFEMIFNHYEICYIVSIKHCDFIWLEYVCELCEKFIIIISQMGFYKGDDHKHVVN
jgi:hypothetical protein